MSSLLIPNIDVFEERSAIAQHEEGLTRKQAEDLAAQAQGFRIRGKAGRGHASFYFLTDAVYAASGNLTLSTISRFCSSLIPAE